jgi:1-acyl-sn-glycerol-3-phosphate acyltransferase
MIQSTLLLSKKFYPMFWTQALGAANNNIFKNALIILITFKSTKLMGLGVEQMVALCGGIFIAPFFFFSALAGECSDKWSKSRLVTLTKFLEVFIMLLGSVGLLTEFLPLLFFSLFLMGLQATFFGPAKFSILPELLEEDDIVKGNALVEMGTFLAILTGTILGGAFIGLHSGTKIVSLVVVGVALLGLFFSLKLPRLDPIDPTLKLDWNLFRSTYKVMNIGRSVQSVFISILGISWFWFFGATLLSIFPVYVKDVLHANEQVVTLFLAIFSIGVALGSIICEKCSHKRIELGLVPFGSIGLCWFVFHLYLMGRPYEISGDLLNITGFMQQSGSYWILFDLAGLSIMSGFFIVPLYTFIQMRSERSLRSRVIACNNILNALFMVGAAGFLIVFFSFGFKTTDVFLALFLMNVAVSLYIYTVIPEFLWRFICVLLGKMLYRLKVQGLDHIPLEGPALLTCNHVSFVDWLVISASVKRPVRFIMHYSFMKIPVLSFFFRGAKVIPIAGAKEDPELMEEAFDKIAATLEDNEIVCIFPEGKITYDGNISPFRPGIEKIISRTPVPVIPMAIRGLWGSFFSRKYGPAGTNFKVIPKRWFSKVDLMIEPALAPQMVTAESLQEKIKNMMD